MEANKISDKRLLAGFSLVSLVAMGIGFYRVWRGGDDLTSRQPEELQKQEQQINKQLDYLSNLQALLSEKADNIEKKYQKNAPHILTADCLKEILEFTPIAVDPHQLEKIYTNNRKARRSCFGAVKDSLGQGSSSDLERYYRFVCTFEEQVQYLIEKSQKDFVVFLDIDYSMITDSIDFHKCKVDSEFIDWVRTWSNQIKEQLREKLPLYQQPVDPALILQIANYQIQILSSENKSLIDAIRDLNLQSEDEQDAIPTFLQLFLEDLIHQKYQIQIEQTNLATEDMTQELQQKLHILNELQNSVLHLMMGGAEEEDYSQRYSEEERE